jgi:hypothetical protein
MSAVDAQQAVKALGSNIVDLGLAFNVMPILRQRGLHFGL